MAHFKAFCLLILIQLFVLTPHLWAASSSATEEADERSEVETPQGILNGYNCNGERWCRSTVALWDAEPKIMCSGVLIRKNWVLTAAHCIFADLETVGFGEDGTESLTTIAERIVHPHYLHFPNSNCEPFNNPDLALLRLATPVSMPQSRIAGGASTDAIIGKSIVHTGFGFQDYGLVYDPITNQIVPQFFNSGILQQMITSVTATYPISFLTTEIGLGIAPGDSGGPAFIAGTTKILGIHSCGGFEVLPDLTVEFLSYSIDLRKSDSNIELRDWVASFTGPAPEVVAVSALGATY